ncbi:DUF2513 domain-containing protein [Macrococcoides caseolyticum]|uniref:DUF2513 domain-containing protein n=1 Tax=Macrococcoides caseolyticum TaxID=69966 RepID=UPI0012FF111A|nr:DUF2513 domain-containing protein [Macrococcus caseolyticus]
MQLKPDCVREVLLLIESKELDEGFMLSEIDFSVTEFSPQDYIYTFRKLHEAGYLKTQSFMGEDMLIQELTFDGHQYLETIRSPKAWSFAKEKAADLGSFSLKTLGSIAQGYIENYIKGLF